MGLEGNAVTAFVAGAAGASALLVSLLKRNSAWSRRLLGYDKKIQHVPTPNPDYKPGDKQPAPFKTDKYVTLDPEKLGDDMYPFIISAVVPRPVAFISSLSKDGAGNLSPYR